MKKFILITSIIFLLIIFLIIKINNHGIIILTYHKIVKDDVKEEYFQNNNWVDRVSSFEKQMKFLYDNNYRTISMDEYYAWKKQNKHLPLKTVLITFDDGDLGFYYDVLPILKKYNFKATVFLIGEQVPNISPAYIPSQKQYLGKDIISKIEKEYSNVSFESHSYGLHNNEDRIAYIHLFSEDQLDEDFKNMNEVHKSHFFCYPYGDYDKKIDKYLEKYDYKLAFILDKSKVSKRSDKDYEIPRVTIDSNCSFINFKKWLLKALMS